jgi:hypothetical protein
MNEYDLTMAAPFRGQPLRPRIGLAVLRLPQKSTLSIAVSQGDFARKPKEIYPTYRQEFQLKEFLLTGQSDFATFGTMWDGLFCFGWVFLLNDSPK